jgi:UPF0755 protein
MPRSKKGRKLGCLLALPLLLVLAAFGAFLWLKSELAPMPRGAPYMIHYRKEQSFDTVIEDLKRHGVVRDVFVLKLYAKYKHEVRSVPEGTYRFNPGMTVDEVLGALHSKIVQMVRIPETNFSYRTANLLQQKGVLDAQDYKDLVKSPSEFRDDVSFNLPKYSLEGYLYPDTYDLPPLLGAHDTISRQLKAFQEKVYPLIKDAKDPNKVLTVASMVEMEAAKDKDRPLIAGVILNRLNKGMPLQIDATILYALQQWRRLTFADYRNTISPYNTYLHKGLPPGPICSPSLKSVMAAVHPAKHNYYYYVALPTGYHLFANTYQEHLANIARRKAAMAKKR